MSTPLQAAARARAVWPADAAAIEAARDVPPGAAVVNGFDRPPVAPSSVLAYVVCRTTHGLDAHDFDTFLAIIGVPAAQRGAGASPDRALVRTRN